MLLSDHLLVFSGFHFFELIADQFRHTSWPEWVGVITAFMCIYLAAKENILSWPVSIISVVAYSWVFYEAKMYGDMSLQVYFLFTAIYGWYFWSRKNEVEDKPVDRLRSGQWLLVTLSIVALSVLLALFLKHFTDTDVPYADGFCTAMSFVAQILLTRKILQNWIIWIVVDVCYIPLYIYKSLNLSAVLYAVLVALAIKGYIEWKRTYLQQTTDREHTH